MRRVLILALYFSICHSSAMALSGRFGAECSPSYAINRVYSRTKPALYDQGGALALHFGGAYHLVLQEHCNLSLGLSYAFARLSVAREASESVPPIDETYFLRYILIPVLCRFYTSEVMIDTSFYIKLGALLSINLPTRSATPSDSPPPAGFTKRALGCFVLLGGGVKYDFSLTNSLVVGISYCWDVPGVIYKKNATNGLTNYNCHNNFICLDLCCLF